MLHQKGNIVSYALSDKFDVIIHGCNCFCKMGSGVALALKNLHGWEDTKKVTVDTQTNILSIAINPESLIGQRLSGSGAVTIEQTEE